jgi:hypothetical protein
VAEQLFLTDGDFFPNLPLRSTSYQVSTFGEGRTAIESMRLHHRLLQGCCKKAEHQRRDGEASWHNRVASLQEMEARLQLASCKARSYRFMSGLWPRRGAVPPRHGGASYLRVLPVRVVLWSLSGLNKRPTPLYYPCVLSHSFREWVCAARAVFLFCASCVVDELVPEACR